VKFRGLFIGLTTIDIQFFVDHYPKSNVKIKTRPPSVLVGGPATNAAVAFAKLNKGAFLASATGQNAFAGYISRDFEQNQINSFDLINQQEVNPVIATVVTAGNGERNILTHNPAKIKASLSGKTLLDKTQPEIVLLDGFYPEISIDCAKEANAKNIPVVIDAGSWKIQYLEILKHTDIAICSADFYPPGCANSDEVFEYLQNRGVNKIAISKGDKCILFYDGTKRGEIIINKIKVEDTLGAGDFLHGAFCYYYCKYRQFSEALKLAAELATYTCRYKGTRKWLNYFPE